MFHFKNIRLLKDLQDRLLYHIKMLIYSDVAMRALYTERYYSHYSAWVLKHCLTLQLNKKENAPCHRATATTATGHGRTGTFRVHADLTTRGSRSQLQQPLVVLLDGDALWSPVRVESYIVNPMVFILVWCGCTCLENRIM